MLCDVCRKNNATNYKCVFENGNKKFLHLCSSCCEKLYSNDFKTVNVAEKFKFDDQIINKSNKVCPCCFSTYKSILNSGKLGCNKCYEVFLDDVLPAISNVQHTTKHVGKRYANKV